MKFLESFAVACLITIFVLILVRAANPTLFQHTPRTTYECPCELSQLETDVLRHTNKDGIETVTTYIDIKDCIKSNNN